MKVPTAHFFERSLLSLTIRVGKLITIRVHQLMSADDQALVGPNMGILVDLSQKDGVRQQDLAVVAIKDKATIARGLKSLEESGLVLRMEDPIDRRTKRIYITAEGRKLVQRVFPLAKEVIDRAGVGIPTEDLQVCHRVLKQMYENLGQPLQVQPEI